MKKIIFSTMIAVFAVSAQAADYPDSCVKLEDLTNEMADLMPEMKAQLDATGSEDERKAAARKAFSEMKDSEQEQAAAGCEAAVKQAEQLIEQIKAQNSK